MGKLTRRDFLKVGAAAGSVLAGGTDLLIADANAAVETWTPQIEKDAELRVVRWNKFVQKRAERYYKA